MPASFLSCIRDIPEHRIVGMLTYPLDEMLLTALVGVVCGAEDFDDAESIGNELLGWLRGFLPYEHGIAAAQTLRKFFRLVDAKALASAFASWVAWLQQKITGIVAIDGKALRGQHPRQGRRQGPAHGFCLCLRSWSGAWPDAG